MPGICDRLNLQNLQDRGRVAEQKPEKGASKRERRRLEREHDVKRDKCRRQVVSDDGYKCRRCACRVWREPSKAPSILTIAHVHEWIWRSWGGDDTDPTNCLTLCGACHAWFHPRLGLSAQLWMIVACDEQQLMRGLVEFVPVREAI